MQVVCVRIPRGEATVQLYKNPVYGSELRTRLSKSFHSGHL